MILHNLETFVIFIIKVLMW